MQRNGRAGPFLNIQGFSLGIRGEQALCLSVFLFFFLNVICGAS